MVEKFNKHSVKESVLDLQEVEYSFLNDVRNPIIFDTNFLFVTFQFHIDVISEVRRLFGSGYSFFIYEGTIDELASVERKKDKNKHFIPLIVKMLHIYGFKIIRSKMSYIDEQILENVGDDTVIATNDKELRQEIIRKRGKVLYVRNKSYLELK